MIILYDYLTILNFSIFSDIFMTDYIEGETQSNVITNMKRLNDGTGKRAYIMFHTKKLVNTNCLQTACPSQSLILNFCAIRTLLLGVTVLKRTVTKILKNPALESHDYKLVIFYSRRVQYECSSVLLCVKIFLWRGVFVDSKYD